MVSISHPLGGTSTAGEQLKKPCGCTQNQLKLYSVNQASNFNPDMNDMRAQNAITKEKEDSTDKEKDC